MENIVIGTAGHIDHGKTTLIKKLTGINTDVLPEEQKRGITINIGFSYIENNEGKKIGIIDVPGHEKFIKNMVAGANGIHYLLMVIACDDGIMQQTEEHFNICNLLGIKNGLIVLTKTDLCSNERIVEVEKDIENYFKGTFLENSKIFKPSVNDEKSYVELKKEILNDIDKIKLETQIEKKFSLAVDRVFSVKGFGVVVTGTSLNNVVKIGDELTVYPNKHKVRVKKIENHGKSLETLQPGNRCALNLGGIGIEDIKRGDTLSENSNLESTSRIDCFFTVLKSYKKVKNNSQVRINIGTKEVIAKIKIFEKNELVGGESSYIQLELSEPIIAMEDELGIIRSLSQVTTIGGFRIINIFAKETKRNNEEYLKVLDTKFKGDKYKNLELFFKNKNGNLTSKEVVRENFKNLDFDIIEKNENVSIFFMNETTYYGLKEKTNEIKEKLKKYFDEFYEKNLLKHFKPKAEIKSKIFEKINTNDFNIYIDFFINENFLEVDGNKIALKEHKVTLNKEQKRIKDEILNKYKSFEFSPVQKKSILSEILDVKERNKVEEMMDYLIEKGLLVYLGEDIYILSGFFKESIKKIELWFESNDKIKLAEFKILLDAPRRITLLILEKFDTMKITEKKDDYRILRSRN